MQGLDGASSEVAEVHAARASLRSLPRRWQLGTFTHKYAHIYILICARVLRGFGFLGAPCWLLACKNTVNTDVSLLRSHLALKMAAPASLRSHLALKMAAQAPLRSHLALKMAAQAPLWSHLALKMAVQALLWRRLALKNAVQVPLQSHLALLRASWRSKLAFKEAVRRGCSKMPFGEAVQRSCLC